MTGVIALLMAGGFAAHLILPDKEFSLAERRKLVQFPEISISRMMDGTFFRCFDQYMADQFPGRECFRGLKNKIELSVFYKLDVHGIYELGGSLYENSENSEKAVRGFAKKLAFMTEHIPEDAHIYYSIIPDKSEMVYTGLHTKYDTEEIYKIIGEALGEKDSRMKPADFNGFLRADDYYLTDIHWRQEKLWPVVGCLAQAMGFASEEKLGEVKKSYSEKSYAPFYGTYYGRYAALKKADILYYLESPLLDGISVEDKIEGKSVPVYSEGKLGGMDSYDVFLGGAVPYLEIENKNSFTKKALVLFRDSYGSALVPLLMPFYSKITMIDLRYMPFNKLEDFLTWEGQDILFLYSAMMVNHSDSLKV